LALDRFDAKSVRLLGFSEGAWAQADEQPDVLSNVLIAGGGRARSRMEGWDLSAKVL